MTESEKHRHSGKETHGVSNGIAYFVYDADGITPLLLDVETDPATHTLKRLMAAESPQVIPPPV